GQVGAAGDRADTAAVQVTRERHGVSGTHHDGLVEHRVRAGVEETALALRRDRRAAPDPAALALREAAGEIGPLAEGPMEFEAHRLGHRSGGARLVAVAGAVRLGPE